MLIYMVQLDSYCGVLSFVSPSNIAQYNLTLICTIVSQMISFIVTGHSTKNSLMFWIITSYMQTHRILC